MHALATEIDEPHQIKPLVRNRPPGGGFGKVSLFDAFRRLKVCAGAGAFCKSVQAPAAAEMIESPITIGAIIHDTTPADMITFKHFLVFGSAFNFTPQLFSQRIGTTPYFVQFHVD